MKKRYLFLILIICLFTVSAVSAEQTNDALNYDNGILVVNEETDINSMVDLSAKSDNEMICESNEDYSVNASAVGADYSGNLQTSNKVNTYISIEIEDFCAGSSELAIISLNEDATGEVIIYIDGEKVETVTVSYSEATYTVQDLSAGEHTMKAVYTGDANYFANSASVKFNVIPFESYIDIDIRELEQGENLFIEVPSGATGTVTLSVNGKTYNLPINNYYAIFNTSLLPAGEYPIKVYYSGDDMYSDCELTSTITIYAKYIISAPDVVKYYRGSERFVVTLSDGWGIPFPDQSISISINGATYIRTTDDDGQASIAIGLNTGVYEVIVKYENVNISSSVTVLSTILANDVVKIYKNNTQYYATFLDSEGNYLAKGTTVQFNLDMQFYNENIFDNKGTAKLDINNKPGTYIVTSINPINGEMSSNNITVISNIVENQDLIKYYNESDRFSVRILDSTGNPASAQKVKFIIGNMTYNGVSDSKGYANLNEVLQPGDYNVISCYNDFNVSNTITILPTLSDKEMNISSSNIYRGEMEVIGVILPADATGEVSTIINNKTYSAKLTNGTGNIVIPDLKLDSYNIEVIYSGDSQYNSVKRKTSFIVESSYVLDVQDLTKYYKGTERFTATLTDKNNNAIKNATISIIINGQEYTKTTDDNGIASMAVNLNSGVYNVTTEYDEIKTYSTITINPTVIAKNFSKIFKNGTQYCGTFTDSNGNLLINTDVKFNINGVFYTRTTDSNGVAKMNINLAPGTYVLTAENPSNGEQQSTTIKVLSSIVENHDLTKYFKNASQYSIRILDSHGNPAASGVSVVFNINGVFYTRYSDASGYVKMNINLAPGEYIITAEYNGLMASNLIKVLPILDGKDVSMKFRDGTRYEVKLFDGQGNSFASQVVTFNINGVFYQRMTDENGIASLNINLQAGNYIITSEYNGMMISNTIRIAPDYIYYTIKGPLDYEFTNTDWFWSDQQQDYIKEVHDIYGNDGVEFLNVNSYGAKYDVFDVNTFTLYLLDENGNVIYQTYMG